MRVPLTLMLIGMLCSGCYVGPVYKLKQKQLTCSEPFIPWGGGLVTHVLQGNGDGAFDYDPLGDLLDRISGSMNLRSGDFAWVEDYAADSYRATNTVTGFGTIWRDGDLDVAYDVAAVTDEGDTFSYTVRERRLGCDMERWVEQNIENEPDPSEVWDGVFTDGGFEYEHRYGLYGDVVVADGRTEPDGSFEESLRYEDGNVVYRWDEEGDGDGQVRREFDEVNGFTLEGYWEREKNGDVDIDYTYEAKGEVAQHWAYDLDEKGNGSGRLTIGNTECDLVLSAFECELDDCSQKSLDGDPCVPPVRIPRLDLR